MSAPESVEEFARDLYVAFRLGDYKKVKKIVVIPPVGEGLSVAIIDRLGKAAGISKNTNKWMSSRLTLLIEFQQESISVQKF